MVILVKVIIVIVMKMLTVDTHVSYNKCVNSSKVACRKQAKKNNYCLSSWSANHDHDDDTDHDDDDSDIVRLYVRVRPIL